MTTISWFDSPTTVDVALANADRARAAGLHRYWNPQIAVTDPMVVLGIVAREIPDIGLGTSVVAMQSTFAKNLAIQSRTILSAFKGTMTPPTPSIKRTSSSCLVAASQWAIKASKSTLRSPRAAAMSGDKGA